MLKFFKRFNINRKWILTCGGLGFFPLIPGTIGSLAAILFGAAVFSLGAYFGYPWAGTAFLLVSTLFLFFKGIVWGDRYIEEIGAEDPKQIVLDEWVGQILALLIFIGGMALVNGLHGSFRPAAFYKNDGKEVLFVGGLICGGLFILFRYFDIAKPWHVGRADRDLKGGLGVMMDDVFAGVYAGVIALVLGWLTIVLL